MAVCKQCNTGFEVTDSDRQFYEKVSPVVSGHTYLISEPTQCPACRLRRRLAWHNMMNLYHRKCDYSGESILTNISPDKKFIVYDTSIWWSDCWNQHQSGRDFDFNRPFFDQFEELMKASPFPNLFSQSNTDENSRYTNYALYDKNCYLIFHANNNEDCLYGFGVKFSKNVVDVYGSFSSELLYQCVDCENCFNLKYSQDCENCTDSYFLFDCIGCKKCIACNNLRNAEYCIFNKKVSQAEFKQIEMELKDGSYKTFVKWKSKFSDWLKTQPHRDALVRQCENCSGDHLFRCQNVHDSFDVRDTRDGKYLNRIFNGPNQDLYDVYQFGMKTELAYECSIVGINAYELRFSALCRNEVSNLNYCFNCHLCKNCFGCSGLHNQEFCIFNKQYGKEEYEELVPRIIKHMMATREWGEFFPVQLSPFAYNETLAMEHFPMTKDEVTKVGWAWKEMQYEMPDVKEVIPAKLLPDSNRDIPDDVLNWAIKSELSDKPFRLTKEELKFYREQAIPIPRLHPDERHIKRVESRNPSKLWDRKCANCGAPIKTSYSPDRSEIVYCESCYLRVVY